MPSNTTKKKKKTPQIFDNQPQLRISMESDPATPQTQNPNLIGFANALFDSIGLIDIPESADVKEYHRLFTLLSENDSAFRVLDKYDGERRWLQGAILNILRPIEKGKQGILKNGEWGAFLKTFGIGEDTSANLRHIHRCFKRLEARQLGYTEMVNQYWDERRLEKDAQGKSNPNGQGKSDKDNGNKTPRSLRVDDLKPKVESITSSLEYLRDEIPTIGDLEKDADKSKSVLVDLRTRLDGIREIINGLETSIDKAYDIAQAYIDKGHGISKSGGQG